MENQSQLPVLRPEHLPAGLTRLQQEFLLGVADGLTRKEAAKRAEVQLRTVTSWEKQPAFKAALDEIFEGAVQVSRSRLGGATGAAVDGLLDALDATKDATLHLSCPACGSEIEVEAKVPNWTARNRAHELILRAAKVLKDVKEVEGSLVTMSIEQKIALGLYRAGKLEQIPAYMWTELQRLGLIPPDEKQPVNVPFRVVEDE